MIVTCAQLDTSAALHYSRTPVLTCRSKFNAHCGSVPRVDVRVRVAWRKGMSGCGCAQPLLFSNHYYINDSQDLSLSGFKLNFRRTPEQPPNGF
ncbi:hypothetical protein CY34DRAFT_553479 [Suillus luteus UH-Slu-Lm8-n1]|uniref:Uncharacterized protein n=1 Tax=Suillus luteus UH-Slu-Lm8-n1 TaxID=930992 RepID=A0A0D0AU35_9AGAM|nr:hypothetical protein CY34DRAFT_553479 [Suillus luteus UH-Slu-Lm8-n1]